MYTYIYIYIFVASADVEEIIILIQGPLERDVHTIFVFIDFVHNVTTFVK